MSGLRKARVESCYLGHGGTICPCCGDAGKLRRYVQAGRFVSLPDELPVIVVNCYCAKCGAEWSERYRLEGLHTIPAGAREDA